MAAVTICSDFGAQENKVFHCFHCFPISSWQIDGETMEAVKDFALGALKLLQMVTAAMKLKDTFSLREMLCPT